MLLRFVDPADCPAFNLNYAPTEAQFNMKQNGIELTDAGGMPGGLMLLTLPFADQIEHRRSSATRPWCRVSADVLTAGGRTGNNVGGGSVSFGRHWRIARSSRASRRHATVATWEVLYFGKPGFAQQKFETTFVESSGGKPPSGEAEKKVQES